MNKLGALMRVQIVEPLHRFTVRVCFRNGVQKVVDLEPFLRGELFAALRNDLALFRTVKAIDHTIGWDNGAAIDPNVLYYDAMHWETAIGGIRTIERT
jgi:hypothetical protein